MSRNGLNETDNTEIREGILNRLESLTFGGDLIQLNDELAYWFYYFEYDSFPMLNFCYLNSYASWMSGW